MWDGGKRLRACVAWARCGTKRPFATKVVVLAAVGERRWPHCHAIERVLMSLLAHRVVGEKKMRQERRDEGEMGI